MDRMALSVIKLSLSKPIALACAGEKTTMRGLTNKLRSTYESPALNQVYLIRKIFNLVLNEGESITKHVNTFITLVGQLASINVIFEILRKG